MQKEGFSMIRKINYTGRRKIPKECFRFRIEDRPDGMIFDAELDLAELATRLPSDAAIFVEAYEHMTYQRFDFGTMEHRVVPENRTLTAFSRADKENIKFRVKVVDTTTRNGCLLAFAHKLRWADATGAQGGRRSLLPPRKADLGDLVWKLELDGEEALLLYNENLQDPHELLRTNDLFAGLVYPEVFRQVLEAILIDPEDADWADANADDDENWQPAWIEFARKFNPNKIPKKDDELGRKRWIEDGVKAFCRKHKSLRRVNGVFDLEGKT
jgi:hypothetical protein